MSAPKVTAKKASAGEWRPAFLRALSRTANVRAACRAADVSRKTAYQHKTTDPAFAAGWDDAMEDACDELEQIARRRASKASDVLLIFLLKAHRPEKYRERTEVKHTGGVALEVVEEIIDGDAPADGPAAPGPA